MKTFIIFYVCLDLDTPYLDKSAESDWESPSTTGTGFYDGQSSSLSGGSGYGQAAMAIASGRRDQRSSPIGELDSFRVDDSYHGGGDGDDQHSPAPSSGNITYDQLRNANRASYKNI